MSVTEIKQAQGEWSLRLSEDTPQQVRDALTFYGHIAILPGELPVAQYGDALLASARYVGVLRGWDAADGRTLKGSGMAFWLGDEDGKGDVFEAPTTFSNETFANTVRGLLPPSGSITEGTINSVAGTYSGKHQWQNPRQALTYVTDTFGAEFRVNYTGTLDAGLVSQLYVTTPKAILLRKGFGADLSLRALPGRMAMGVDGEDTTTRVVLLAEGEGDAIVTASANAPATPYKDIHGNPIKVTRLVSESGTEATNAPARAQLQLNRFVNARRAVQLSSNDYDVKGTFVVGDYLNVYDPDNGFIDTAREVYWQGERLNPMALRCVEMTWPIEAGWTVAFRDVDGNWIDLSPYYEPESGETTIVVGDLPRGLASVGGAQEQVGYRPNLPVGDSVPDATIPAAPAFTDVSSGSYQGADGEWTKSAVFLEWAQPLNTDGSVITDGGHYELRYRVNTYIGYQVKWGALNAAGYKWGELSANKWGAPITDPVSTSQEWHVVYVGWDQLQTMVQELTPGVEYEWQIRAVDAANPPKEGPWSASTFVIASGDIFAPDTPAAPVVASSRISIQVMHMLGKASGGTFNLQPDMTHLTVHVGGTSDFLPDDSNMVGKMPANAGMLQANIPAVATFQVEQTDAIWIKVVAVDRAGNRSGPSEGVQATVELIDSAHISDLTASKITAGTIMANILLAAAIRTAESGARVEMSGAGIQAYNSEGRQTVDIDSATGAATVTGKLQTELDGAGITLEAISGQAVATWSVNNGAGQPLDHVFELASADYGAPWNQGVEMGLKMRADVGIQDGGKVLMSEVTNIFSHQPEVGDEAYIALGGWPWGLDTGYGRIFAQGAANLGALGSGQGFFLADRQEVSSSYQATTFPYGATTEGYMIAVAQITGTTNSACHMATDTFTSISVGFNDAQNRRVFLWAVRAEVV